MKYIKLVLSTLLILGLFSQVNAVEPGKIVGGQISELPKWFKESFLDIPEDIEEAVDENRHLMLWVMTT